MTDDEARMTFTEHLGELRTRIIRSGWAVVVGMVICYVFSDQIFLAVKEPLDDSIVALNASRQQGAPEAGAAGATPMAPKWVTQSPMEGFWVKLKLAGYTGFTLALPVVIYQICAFVFPGLKRGERRLMKYLIFGSGLFAVFGVCVAYFVVLPSMMPYLIGMLPAGVEQQFRLNETVSMLIMMLAGFAAAFQFPMAIWVLVYLGLVSPAVLKRFRKPAAVIAAILAAALTPTPDPFTMLVMLTPMILLYEVSIWISYAIVRRRQRDQETESDA